jgi:hypothetical protein
VGVWANSKELMFAQTDWIVTIDYIYTPARKSKDKRNAPCAINLFLFFSMFSLMANICCYSKDKQRLSDLKKCEITSKLTFQNVKLSIQY